MVVGTARPPEQGRAAIWAAGYPRRCEATIVLAILMAITCLFYYEVILLGKTLVPLSVPRSMASGAYGAPGDMPSDPFRGDLGASAWASEPMARKASHEYAAGRFPLWNEHQGFGAPLLANNVSGGMDLLRLPVLLSGDAVTWDAYYLMRTLLGAVATYTFARALGLVAPAGMVFAVAYAFSGHFMLFGNNPYAGVYVLLPVLLLGVDLTVSGRTRSGFVVTAAAIGLDLLIGMPESALFVLLLGAAYGGYRLACLAWDRTGRRSWLTRFSSLAAAGATGIALAAPLLLTLFEYLPNSHSSHASERALGLQYAPLRNVILLGIPYLFGRYWDSAPPAQIHNYVGITVLLLALYGGIPARTSRYRRPALFATLAGGLLLAKTYGAPGVNELGRLPALNVTLIPMWSAPVIGFCFAWLAGIGVHRLLTEQVPAWVATLALAGVGVFASLGVLLNWERVARAPAAQLVVSLCIALYFAVVTWAVLRRHRSRPSPLASVACGLLVVWELFTYAPRGVYQDRYDPFTEPPFVGFLQAARAEESFRVFGTDGFLYPNTSTAYGISDIRALDALYVDRYFAYIQAFISPNATDRFTGHPRTSTEGEALFRDNPWFDLTGVRYMLVVPKTEHALLDGPEADGQYRRVYDGEVRIYENHHALPRAFLVGNVEPVDDRAAAIAAMKRGDIHPAHSAVVENPPPDQVARVQGHKGTVTMREYDGTHVAIDTNATGPSFLVLTDSFYPGWSASVDGVHTTIYATDLAFRGIFVPAGQHQVEFAYRPVSFAVGLAIALIALLIMFGILISALPWPRASAWRLRRIVPRRASPSIAARVAVPLGPSPGGVVLRYLNGWSNDRRTDLSEVKRS